jgi:outer membrane biosynthesis protein TonB
MERRSARLWVALVGALGLHALVLVAVAYSPRGKHAPSPPQRVLQVELRRLAPPTPEIEPVRPAPVPQRDRAPAAGPRLPAQTPTPGARAETERADRSSEWRAAGIDRLGGRLSLQLEHPETALPGPGARGDDSSGLVREKSREEKLAEEKATVSRRIEGWFSDEKARQRAQATGRDAYWQAVEDGLRRGFDPGWDVLEQGPNVPKSRLGVFFETWKKQAASYGATGNPFAGVPGAPGTIRPLHAEFTDLANEDRGLRGVSFDPTVQVFNLLFAGAPTSAQAWWPNSLVALVRITLREDGSLFGVELAGTSGNKAYDRLALGRARSLNKLALAPPALVTLWAFETDFTQAPPLPIAGCALDDFIPKNCWGPLQKRVRSRVRLMAIY